MSTKNSAKQLRSVATHQAGRLPPTTTASKPGSRNWRIRREELAAFERKHGHCRVSALSKNRAGLYRWVCAQRLRRSLGKLSQEQIRSLDELGFSWDGQSKTQRDNQARWDAMYEVLAAYQRTHGHCRIPCSTGEHARLCTWLAAQRDARRNRRLSAERVRRLSQLGIAWDTHVELRRMNEARWLDMYNALAVFRQEHGNCLVPNSKEHAGLRKWIGKQRIAKRRGTLSKDRVRWLDRLGFDWDIVEAQWNKMFEALVNYKNLHGDCAVPGNWPRNPSLASWVNRQRKLGQQGSLALDRKKRLEKLGFSFSEVVPVRSRTRKPRRTTRPAGRPPREGGRLVVVGVIFPRI